RSLTEVGAADLARIAGIPRCRFDLVYDPEAHRLDGRESMSFTNRGPDALADLAFHTFGNAAVYHGAELTITAARVDGVEAVVEPVRDGTAAMVHLPTVLASGAETRIDLTFHTTLSTHGGLYGLLASDHGVDCFYGWHPELAVRRDGRWQLHPVGQHGDPTQNEMFHALVTIRLPSGSQLMSSGSEVSRTLGLDGASTTVISSAFTRNLVLVVGSGFQSLRRQVGGTEVVSWHRPESAIGGQRALDTAADALDFFAERLGPYPYREFDVVEAQLGEAVGGMESTGLILIDRANYTALSLAGDPGAFETMPTFMMAMVVSHETAHQWWYDLVGSDSYLYPWLDESLTNWTGCWYLEQRMGPVSASGGFQTCLMECGADPTGRTMPLNLAADAYPDDLSYGGVIYGRGALMYQALRRKVGDAAFGRFLAAYQQRFRYGYARESDLLSTLAETLGQDTQEWFRTTWVEGVGLTPRDLMEASRAMPRSQPGDDAKDH
ncbi:MAG: M1 family metallopeptidase, partial [Planctomycetes bacterium]|nr:M1 family metallopeptidase [Planctomycetota bacterium]